jgi:hypothetical protein
MDKHDKVKKEIFEFPKLQLWYTAHWITHLFIVI